MPKLDICILSLVGGLLEDPKRLDCDFSERWEVIEEVLEMGVKPPADAAPEEAAAEPPAMDSSMGANLLPFFGLRTGGLLKMSPSGMLPLRSMRACRGKQSNSHGMPVINLTLDLGKPWGGGGPFGCQWRLLIESVDRAVETLQESKEISFS